jgi:aspartate aminotransferase, mitochondrial
MIRNLLCKRPLYNFSMWSKVPESPMDPILGATQSFNADKNPKKVLLGVGAYRDDNGKPWILPSVQQALDSLNRGPLDNEYLPIDGDREYIQKALELAYGAEQPNLKQGCVAGIQTLSGCGGVRLGLELIKKNYPQKPICVPNPSWPIHK